MPIPSSPGPDRRQLLSGLLLLLLILAFTRSLATQIPQNKQEPPAKIAVSGNLVLITASVTDARGPFAPGLKADEFRVLEDGRQPELTIFEVGDTPVTVGSVDAHNRSMRSKLPGLAAAENTTLAPMEKEAE
jgi:hypothetical protein